MDNSAIIFDRLRRYLDTGPFKCLNLDVLKLEMEYTDFWINIKNEKIFVTFHKNLSVDKKEILTTGLNKMFDGVAYNEASEIF